MLILTRKPNQSVIVNDKIVVTVIEMTADRVRLGFSAPRDVPVHRAEVWGTIHGWEKLAELESRNR